MDCELYNGTTVADLMYNEKYNSIAFFDVDCSGDLSEQEINIFKNSKIETNEKEIKITLSNKEIKIFENIAIPKSEEYYKSGKIKVAVVDTFDNSHGTIVANILKQENPNLSVHKFDCDPSILLSPDKKSLKKLMVFLGGPSRILDKLFSYEERVELALFAEKLVSLPDDFTQKAISKALEQLKTEIANGEDYKAVNLSSGLSITYEQINEICKEKIGEEITPENCAKYKMQIKEILREKANTNKDFQISDTRYPLEPLKLSSVIDIIDKIEKLNIPVYVAMSYKSNNNETFNLFSLASNSKTVESGIENPNKSVNEPFASSSSFALDEMGKRRIALPIHNIGGYLEYCSTSFATPMVLANDLKKINK